jgi:hypothetical protein
MTEELYCPACLARGELVPVDMTKQANATCTKLRCGQWWEKKDIHLKLPSAANIQRWKYLKWQLSAGILVAGPDDGADRYPESVEAP